MIVGLNLALGVTDIINDTKRDLENQQPFVKSLVCNIFAVTVDYITAGLSATMALMGNPALAISCDKDISPDLKSKVKNLVGCIFDLFSQPIDGYIYQGGFLNPYVKADMLNSMETMLSHFGAAGNNPYSDPLIVNLANSGNVTTTDLEHGVNFDLDKSGTKEQTGWLTQSEAFIVNDRNDDGIINNGGELFGDQTVKSDGTTASSGFEALKEFDSNNDGKISAEDPNFNMLKVWEDDGDGITEAGELKSLTEAGIKEISLTSREIRSADASDNIMMRETDVTMTDDSIHKAAEYLFKRDTLNTVSLTSSGEEDNPILRGYGNVPSLASAMGSDAVLKTMVEEFIEYPISNTQFLTFNENTNKQSTINYQRHS